MGEHFYGELRIGGRITREQFDRMVGIEPLLEGFDPDTLVDGGRGDVGPEVRDGVLWFGDPQASFGEFCYLEAYLREQGIPYDRHSSGYHEFNAEESGFRPGLGCVTAPATDDGTILADAAEVLSYLERGVTMADLPSPDDGGDEGLALVILRRDRRLPPFEFVEAEKTH